MRREILAYLFGTMGWVSVAFGAHAQDSNDMETLALEVFPKLSGSYENPACQAMLAVAQDVFDSNSEATFFVTPEVFQNEELGIVLAPIGPDEYLADPVYFEEVDLNGSINLLGDREHVRLYRYFLQRTPIDGQRLVLAETPTSWRGNSQAVYAISDQLDHEDILTVSTSDVREPMPEYLSILSREYFEPWIIWSEAAGAMVIVKTSGYRWSSGTWNAYTLVNGEREYNCGIAFNPDVTRQPEGALSEIAVLLDDIIGINRDHGTLDPFAEIRGDVAQAWKNALYRPWALKEPYNGVEEVEAGLERWARGAPVYQRQYERLELLYPQAVEALAQYYSIRFPEEDAATLAGRSMDLVLRSHFVFSKMY